MKYKTLTRRLTLWSALLVWGGALVSCAAPELTPEYAFERIAERGEFRMPYYAPMRIGEQVLTRDNHDAYQQYIRKHYGTLIDAGLVEVRAADRNSWRTVIDVRLTPKGEAMADPRRSTPKEVYVQVCRMVPVRVEELRTVAEGEVVECAYLFEERDISPFGLFLGFQQGRTYPDKCTFVRTRRAWNIQ